MRDDSTNEDDGDDESTIADLASLPAMSTRTPEETPSTASMPMTNASSAFDSATFYV